MTQKQGGQGVEMNASFIIGTLVWEVVACGDAMCTRGKEEWIHDDNIINNNNYNSKEGGKMSHS